MVRLRLFAPGKGSGGALAAAIWLAALLLPGCAPAIENWRSGRDAGEGSASEAEPAVDAGEDSMSEAQPAVDAGEDWVSEAELAADAGHGAAPGAWLSVADVGDGADWYVSPTGDDRATGDHPEFALRTIGRAFELVGPGETIFVLPGEYSEMIDISGLGNPDLPIVLSGVPGESILDGRGELPTAIWCEECWGITLENLVVRDYTDAGVVFLYAEGIRLLDLGVEGNGFDPQVAEWEFEGYGIEVESSSEVWIEGNQVIGNGPNPKRLGRLMGSSINVYACHRCVIRENLISRNTGGMVVEDSVDVLVEDNLIFENDLDATAERWWDGAIWLDGGRDVTLRGNLIRDNLGPGLQISDEELAGPTGYVLEDNLVTGNLIGLHLWNFGTWELPGEPTLRAEGNLIRENELIDVSISPGWCFPPEPCEADG